VVAETRHNFELSGVNPKAPAVLPLPPTSRRPPRPRTVSRRPTRLPRRILPANQIFNTDISPNRTLNNSSFGHDNSTTTGDVTSSTLFPTDSPPRLTAGSGAVDFPTNPIPSPARPRRNTIASRSPRPSVVGQNCENPAATPSKQKERSRSSGRHLQTPISPVAALNLALDRSPPRDMRPQRLSALVDKDAFLASLSNPAPLPTSTPKPIRTPDSTMSCDTLGSSDLTSSPFIVEAYPIRHIEPSSILDTPSRLRTQSECDRLLLASTGVQRVGQGYQFVQGPTKSATETRRTSRLFASNRRSQMPPPVSSKDMPHATPVDEVGVILRNAAHNLSAVDHDEQSGIWNTFKSVVTGRTSTRRVTRIS
jgi:serine/threonine-protein kinase GIN4